MSNGGALLLLAFLLFLPEIWHHFLGPLFKEIADEIKKKFK